MKINVLFFANLREVLDCAALTVETVSGSSVADLCAILAERGERWQSIFADPAKTLKIALNQEMAEMTTKLSENDEVAFFPPVTGG